MDAQGVADAFAELLELLLGLRTLAALGEAIVLHVLLHEVWVAPSTCLVVVVTVQHLTEQLMDAGVLSSTRGTRGLTWWYGKTGFSRFLVWMRILLLIIETVETA